MSNIRKIETHNVTDDSQGHNDVLHPLACLGTYSSANFCVFVFLQKAMKHNPSPPSHSIPGLQHPELPVWQLECYQIFPSAWTTCYCYQCLFRKKRFAYFFFFQSGKWKLICNVFQWKNSRHKNYTTASKIYLKFNDKS